MTVFLEWVKKLLRALLEGCTLALQRIWKILNLAWNWIQCIAQILMPLRFSLVTIFLVALLFLWSAPGKDLLLSMADQKTLFTSEIILFFVALFSWSMCLWYWSRVMMRFVHDDFLDTKEDTEKEKKWKVGLLIWFRKHIPRLVGLVPFIIMFFAFPQASQVYSGQISDVDLSNLNFLHWISFVLGGFYYLIVFFRRKIILRNDDSGLDKQHYAPHHKGWRDLGLTSFVVLVGILGLSTVIFVMVWINPQVATSFGTGSVLFLASASWVAFGSSLVSLGRGFKFPVITAGLIGALMIGPWTDNHQVRTLNASASEKSELTRHMAWDQRLTVEQDFYQWLATRAKVFDKNEINPIFIISAEGGGIRAAYWTANLLAAFQDANENFANHVYALSGISGGSLGTALFVNLLQNQDNLNCPDPGTTWKIKKIRKCAHSILSEDFLTPTVASMLYPDLIQRVNFLSYFYKFPDRAYALETSFEKAWKKHLGNDRFSRSFLESWDAPENSKANLKLRLPSLFLNSTWVEGGKRVIASNVQIIKEHFPDAEDLFSILCKEIPLSTAVHNSARFSYVSPAGTVEEPLLRDNPLLEAEPCRQRLAEAFENETPISEVKDLAERKDISHQTWGHVVDGGYFENSGNTTTFDILSSIEDAFFHDDLVCGPEDRPDLQFKCLPVIITLINDPELAAASKLNPNDTVESHDGNLPQDSSQPNPDQWLTEPLSPIKTLFQTRDGRGGYARDSTQKYVERQLQGLYLEFSLHDKKGALPLSWVLSELVKDNIQKQVDEVLQDLAESPDKTGDPLNIEQLIRYRLKNS